MFDKVLNSLRAGDPLVVLVFVLMALVLLLLVGWLVLFVRIRRLSRRMHGMTLGVDGSMEEVLRAHLDTVQSTSRSTETLQQAVTALQQQMPLCLSHAKIIRYDAFDDVGGEQSFSLALLDAQGSGLVLTSVYSRNDMRVYAKSILNGNASHGLSAEEKRLLSEAAAQ